MDESKRRVAERQTVWLLAVGLAVGLSCWTLFYRQKPAAIEKVGQRDGTFESDQNNFRRFDQVERLRKLLGKEIPATIEEEFEFTKQIEPILSDPWNRPFRGVPWYVWATNNSKPKRFLVFEGENSTVVPGNSFAWIHVFDESGKKLKDWSFSTGSRMNLNRASFAYADDLAAHLITIETVPQFHLIPIETAPKLNGRPVSRQYFAFSDDHLQFLRAEDAEARMLDNNYASPNLTLGIIPEAKSPEAWLRLLESKKEADVLSALTFLGGRHLDPSHAPPDHLHEKIAQTKLVKEMRRDERVGKLVRQHVNSDSQWIKEAARLAARHTRDVAP